MKTGLGKLTLMPAHCDHCEAVQPPLLAVEVAGAALLVEVVVEDEALVVVDLTRVVDWTTAEVVVLLGAALLEPPVPEPEHPTRDELTTISSYQNVLVSPPYDSQPK